MKGPFIALHMSGFYFKGKSDNKREDATAAALKKEQDNRKKAAYPGLDTALGTSGRVQAASDNAINYSPTTTWGSWLYGLTSSFLGSEGDTDPEKKNNRTLFKAAQALGKFQEIHPARNLGVIPSPKDDTIYGRVYEALLQNLAPRLNIQKTLTNRIEALDCNSITYAGNATQAITQGTTAGDNAVNIGGPAGTPCADYNAVKTRTDATVGDVMISALRSLQAERDKYPEVTAENYFPNLDPTDPNASKQPPLTSPLVYKANPQAEEKNWETISGTTRIKGLGPVFGVSGGYIKELGNHMFAGAEAYASKPMMKVSYTLNVEGKTTDYGKVNLSPGFSFGIAAIAGKQLNWGCSIYAKTGVETTSFNMSVDSSQDRPAPGTEYNPQNLRARIKPIFAGAGIGVKYGKVVFRFEYVMLRYSQTAFREFNKLGTDKRRRGYLASGVGHRLSLVVAKHFSS